MDSTVLERSSRYCSLISPVALFARIVVTQNFSFTRTALAARDWATASTLCEVIRWSLAAIPLSIVSADCRSATRIGDRLFLEREFARRHESDHSATDFGRDVTGTSCITCHLPHDGRALQFETFLALRAPAEKHEVTSATTLIAGTDHIPTPKAGRQLAVRNAPLLISSVQLSARLLHFDGQFASAEALVKETFLGRNFGWLPSERSQAIRHFARVIREDKGDDPGAAITAGFPYSTLLRGTDPALPAELRLPPALRCDVDIATDVEIVDACARLVVAFMRTLQFSRDADGLHNGSPYDAFLAANRLARAPAPTQSAADYGRRLAEQVAALRAPRFVDEPARALRAHAGQPFRFGELELHGMRIFFRSAIGAEQKTGAGNCAECHVPPHFTDFNFHNTGAAQDEYDAIHGPGAFSRLRVPDFATRDAHFDRWLPATPIHVDADGPFLKVPDAAHPERTDLGVWNVYGNPDLPEPQPALERLLNPGGGLSRDEVLSRAFARFKTSSLRNLGQSAPYLHTGQLTSIEDTILFYQRTSELARNGRLRNAPPEYFTMRIGADDVAPLAAFLRALNEDYDDGRGQAHALRRR